MTVSALSSSHEASQPVFEPPGTFKRLAPIIFFQIYLGTSFLLFLYGPWNYAVPSPHKLVIFIVAAHLALLLGYLSAAFTRPRGYAGSIPARALLFVSIGVTAVLIGPTLMDLTGGQISLTRAFTEPARVYYEYQARARATEGVTSPITMVSTLLAPITALAIPLVALYWTRSSWIVRLFGVIAVLCNLSIFVFTGRNKGLIDFALLLPWLMVIGASRIPGRKINVRRTIVGLVLVSVVATGFLTYYGRNLEGRMPKEFNPYLMELVVGFGGLRAEAEPEHIFLRNLSPQKQMIVLGLSHLQTHGYMALATALTKPFEPAWGVGHSLILQTIEKRLTGRSELGERSYPARLQRDNGWSIIRWWHTTYTWIASDVSFPGTVLIMFLLGRLFARLWLDSLRGENPFAAGLLVVVITMMYYLPGNNIILGQPHGLSAFWVLLAAWLLFRRPLVQSHSGAAALVPAHAAV